MCIVIYIHCTHGVCLISMIPCAGGSTTRQRTVYITFMFIHSCFSKEHQIPVPWDGKTFVMYSLLIYRYLNGLNRPLFLPFIPMLEAFCSVHDIGAATCFEKGWQIWGGWRWSISGCWRYPLLRWVLQFYCWNLHHVWQITGVFVEDSFLPECFCRIVP